MAGATSATCGAASAPDFGDSFEAREALGDIGRNQRAQPPLGLVDAHRERLFAARNEVFRGVDRKLDARFDRAEVDVAALGGRRHGRHVVFQPRLERRKARGEIIWNGGSGAAACPFELADAIDQFEECFFIREPGRIFDAEFETSAPAQKDALGLGA